LRRAELDFLNVFMAMIKQEKRFCQGEINLTGGLSKRIINTEDLFLKITCPYCMKAIEPTAKTCPECGTSYGTETLKLLRSQVVHSAADDEPEQRQHDQISKTFKISYSSAQSLQACYLSNIGAGGVFIPSNEPFVRGARFDLRIFLPDNGRPLEVYCEVVWSQNEQRKINDRVFPPGMGIKFLNLSPEGQKRITDLLRPGKQ